MGLELQDSVVLITSNNPSNSRFGTGFVVHRDGKATYVLTCAHVLDDVVRSGEEKALIYGHSTEVVVSGLEVGIDLAILKAENLSDKLPLGLSSSGETGDAIRIIGFYRFDMYYRSTQLEGNLGEQTVLRPKASSPGIRALDLEIGGNYNLEPGYSGSPVIDVKSSCVVGIVSHRQGEGKKGLAIAIETVKEIWTQMPPGLLNDLAGSSYDFDVEKLYLSNLIEELSEHRGVSKRYIELTTIWDNPSKTNTVQSDSKDIEPEWLDSILRIERRDQGPDDANQKGSRRIRQYVKSCVNDCLLRLLNLILHTIRGTAKVSSEALLQLLQEAEGAQQAIDIKQAIEQYGKFVLIGDAGSGKTTTIEHLALDAAHKRLENPHVAPLPLLLYLSSWDDEASFSDFVLEQWNSHGFKTDPMEMLARGEIFLYLDSLNEMGAQGLAKAKSLRQWLQSDTAPRYAIIACRSTDYASHPAVTPFDSSSFSMAPRKRLEKIWHYNDTTQFTYDLNLRVVRIVSMNDDQIDKFAKKYLKKEDAELFLGKLLKLLQEDAEKNPQHRLHELAANPFLLIALISIYVQFPDSDFPRKDTELIAKVVKMSWKREEAQNRDLVPLVKLEGALHSLASAMGRENKSVNVSLDYARKYIGEKVLKAARKLDLIIVRGEQVSFSHQWIQEYFDTHTDEQPSPLSLPSETDLLFILLIVATFVFSFSSVFPSFDILSLNLLRKMPLQQTANLIWIVLPIVLTLATLLLAAVYFTFFPVWRLWREKLVPLRAETWPELMPYLAECCREAQLARPPSFVINLFDPCVTGLVFGRVGRYYVALSWGLVELFYRNRASFRVIILHELAHLRNNDVGRTYFTISSWYAAVTVYLIAILFLIFSISPLSPWPHTPVIGNLSLSILLLYILSLFATLAMVIVIRNYLLYIRELYADFCASIWDSKISLIRIISSLSQISARGLRQFLWAYPTPQERLTMLREPIRMFRTAMSIPFFVGFLIAYVFEGTISLASYLISIFRYVPIRIVLPQTMFTAFIVALMISSSYFFVGTIGLQEQRRAVADMLDSSRSYKDYFGPVKAAVLTVLGMQVGLLLTPQGLLSPLRNVPLSLLSAGIITCSLWLWLIYVRFFTLHVFGSMTSRNLPRWLKYISSLSLATLLWISYLPASLLQLSIANVLQNESVTKNLFLVSLLPSLILYALAFGATWIFVRRQHDKMHRCPSCGKLTCQKDAVGYKCEHCRRNLAPWLFRSVE